MFRRSIDSVVSDIAKKVELLHQIATDADADAEMHLHLQRHHEAQRHSAGATADRARSLAGRFHALIS